MYQLDDLIRELRDAYQTGTEGAVEAAVHRAVAERPLVADPTRFQVLHDEPGLTVLHVVVGAGFISPPHDHRTWAVIGVYSGQEDNSFYKLVGETRAIEAAGGRSVMEREILTLGVDAIHRIANPRRDPLIALHVYGRNVLKIERSAWDPVTMRERPYVAKTDNVVVTED
jgi:predicted metal-dependent enzyme (double-stranded beta helix superfamily)